MKKIGFIGLGIMGLPMAKNVVKNCSLPVIGYDVVEKQVHAFEESGGIPASDALEIYKECDIILQMLPTHAIIKDSVSQAIQHGKPGNIIVDLSSTAPNIIQDLYQEALKHEISLLDCPVSGGEGLAKVGKLVLMAGGDRDVFDTVLPVLSCMGEVTYVGASGSGDMVKLINQMLVACNLGALCEAYALGRKAGLDLSLVYQAIHKGGAGSVIMEARSEKLIHEDFSPSARMAVHYKDLVNVFNCLVDPLGVEVPLTKFVYDLMTEYGEREGLNDDHSAIYKLYLERMGILS